MAERRQNSRRRTYLAGRLEIAKLNGWALDCTVKNVSATGARVAIPSDIIVPQTVELTVSDGPRRPAQLIWYREGHAGFALTDRRTLPRPANDAVAAGPQSATRLSARIAAIAARDRTARSHFTGI